MLQGALIQPRRDGTIVMRTERIVGTKAQYYGETSRSIYVRGKQHLSALEKADQHKDNAFVNHRNNFHKGEEQEVRFKLSLVKKFKRPLERQVWEGVEIHKADVDIVMNSKLDHYQPAVGRMTITNQVEEIVYNG